MHLSFNQRVFTIHANVENSVDNKKYVVQKTSGYALAAKFKLFVSFVLINTTSPYPSRHIIGTDTSVVYLIFCSNSIWSKHVLHSATLNIQCILLYQ